MSQALTITPSGAAPRVLLFGHPGSGKSSLSAALIRAGETQGARLGAEVIDPTHRLDRLRDHAYSGVPLEAPQTELVGYPIHLRPWRIRGEPIPGPTRVLILDCDGSAAVELLKDPEPLTAPEVGGTVANAVVETDTIALVVNAGASDTELTDAFDDFLIFLERLRGHKEFGREVGGFPVFLVLAQADRLARRGDNTAKWEARVAARLGYVLDRFEEHLEDDDPGPGVRSPYLPFGSLQVRGYAVALRRPPLADAPHPLNEPFGVAEFFRDCFVSAARHRDRATASDHRLRWTVRAAMSAIGALLIGVGAVLLFQPTPDSGLADAVRLYQAREQREWPDAASRLAAKNIGREERALRRFRDDPAFERLPTELKDFVTGRLAEIEAYRAYVAKLANPTLPTPANVKTEEELAAVEARLTTELALPSEHGTAWAGTEAAALRNKWLHDVKLIREAAAGLVKWYWDEGAEADSRAAAKTFEPTWRTDLAAFVARADRPTVGDVFGTTDPRLVEPAVPIPGSETLPQPRGGPVTFRVPIRFDRVYQARRLWEKARDHLGDFRDLADALALTPEPPADSPAAKAYGVLDIPAPPTPVTRLPNEQLAELARRFPSGVDPMDVWGIARFNEPARSRLAARSEEMIRNGESRVRGLVLTTLGRRPDTATSADWVRTSAALETEAARDWHQLVRFLIRLQSPAPEDRIEKLAAFLKQDRFALDVKGFELTIPEAFQRLHKGIEPTSAEVLVGPGGGLPRLVKGFTVTLRSRSETAAVYQLTPVGDGKFDYARGETLSVQVAVTLGEGKPATLLWNTGGAAAFQFDRLRSPPVPRLERTGAPAVDSPAIKLVMDPASEVPRLPSLVFP